MKQINRKIVFAFQTMIKLGQTVTRHEILICAQKIFPKLKDGGSVGRAISMLKNSYMIYVGKQNTKGRGRKPHLYKRIK